MKLNEVFTDSLNKGIFTYLNDLDIPWKNENISKQLNIAYHYNHSGNKETSPLIDSLLINDSLSDNDKSLLAMSIYSIFSNKWNRLYNILSIEYKPIENYNMEETEKTIDNGESTDNQTNNNETSNSLEEKTINETLLKANDSIINNNTITDSESSNDNNEVTNFNSLYGFNSSTDVNSDKQSGNETKVHSLDNTRTEKINQTITKDDSENTTLNKTNSVNGTLKEIKDNTHTENSTQDRTLTRHGNIGVTTSQQMLQSEIELWEWNFFNTVFNDLDTMLTIQVY